MEPSRRGDPLTHPDFEALLAGRWMNLAGLLLVFLGTAFFLKVAFDHNWIAPAFRVALGVVAGALTIAYAQRLRTKQDVYFSEGLIALGAAIEFLSIYASNALFHLASPWEAAIGMAAVTAVIAALAWRRGSERLGILAAVGGFFAPILTGTSGADQFALAGYIAILDIGMLVLAELIESRFLGPIALFGTLAYAISGFAFAPSLNDLQRADIYVTFYLVFATAGWTVTRLRGKLEPIGMTVNVVAFAGVMLGLEATLPSEYRSYLTVVLLGLTALHLAAAILLKSRYNGRLAAATLALAIPQAFNGALINIGWAVEAIILSVVGMRVRDDVMRVGSVALLAFDVVHDFAIYADYVVKEPFLNGRFASAAAAFCAAFAIASDTDRYGVSVGEAVLVRALRTTAHAIAVVVLSAEAWSAVLYWHGTEQGGSAALSVVCAAIAGVFIAWGLYRRDAFVRWEGLGLLLAAVAKVLLVDLAFLDIGYRVISAVFVGVALIAVSYVYQRRAAIAETEP